MKDTLPEYQRVMVADLIAMGQADQKATDAQMAEMADVSPSVFRQIKSGRLKLPIPSLTQFPHALRVAPEVLLVAVLAETQERFSAPPGSNPSQNRSSFSGSDLSGGGTEKMTCKCGTVIELAPPQQFPNALPDRQGHGSSTIK
jgi:hypothetical protein